jgi:hypothetical protein
MYVTSCKTKNVNILKVSNKADKAILEEIIKK